MDSTILVELMVKLVSRRACSVGNTRGVNCFRPASEAARSNPPTIILPRWFLRLDNLPQLTRIHHSVLWRLWVDCGTLWRSCHNPPQNAWLSITCTSSYSDVTKMASYFYCFKLLQNYFKITSEVLRTCFLELV